MAFVKGRDGAGDVGALFSQEDGSDALIAELKAIFQQGVIEAQRADSQPCHHCCLL